MNGALTRPGARKPAISPRVASYALEQDLVVYDEITREGFILNGTAAQIWTLADGSRTTAALAREIADKYGISYRAAREDVQEFIGGLEQSGLLAGSEKPAPCGTCP